MVKHVVKRSVPEAGPLDEATTVPSDKALDDLPAIQGIDNSVDNLNSIETALNMSSESLKAESHPYQLLRQQLDSMREKLVQLEAKNSTLESELLENHEFDEDTHCKYL